MKKAAFLSYNSIAGFSAGWIDGTTDCKALIIPCSHGSSAAPKVRSEAQCHDVTNEITRLWAQLREHVKELDYIVVYVGSDGSENAITLASELPSEKVTFVMCDCRLGTKDELLRRAGHTNARQIMCECRGLETMGRLCKRFLDTGMIG